MPPISERFGVNHPSLATCRKFFAFAVIFAVVGFAFILRHGWELTRLNWISTILGAVGLAYSYWLPGSERFIAEKIQKRDEILSQCRGLRRLPGLLRNNRGLRQQPIQCPCATGRCAHPRPHLRRRAELHRACADRSIQLPATSDPAVADTNAVRRVLGDGHQSDDLLDRSLAHSTSRSHGACSDDSA